MKPSCNRRAMNNSGRHQRQQARQRHIFRRDRRHAGQGRRHHCRRGGIGSDDQVARAAEEREDESGITIV